MIPTNLSRTPEAALAGKIKSSEVEVDDHTSQGGRTTIGPLWPSTSVIGTCFVRDTVWQALDPTHRPAFPPPSASGHDYEYTMVQYLDGELDNRRFFGFHARAVSTKDHLTLVELWNPGTGIANPTPAQSLWLDLAAVTDPNGPRVDPVKQPVGPIFLEHKQMRAIAFVEPKFPIAVGTFPFAELPPAP